MYLFPRNGVLPGPPQASPGQGWAGLQTLGWAVLAPPCPMAQAKLLWLLRAHRSGSCAPLPCAPLAGPAASVTPSLSRCSGLLGGAPLAWGQPILPGSGCHQMHPLLLLLEGGAPCSPSLPGRLQLPLVWASWRHLSWATFLVLSLLPPIHMEPVGASCGLVSQGL